MQNQRYIDARLTAVVPVDLLRRPAELLRRMVDQVSFPGMSQLKMVIAHNDRGSRHDRALVDVLSRFPHVTLVSHMFYGGAVNNAHLRNRAVEKVDTEMLVLLDADLHPNPTLLAESSRLLELQEERLVILPCLYLTKWASQRLRTGRETPDTILGGYFSFRRRYFQHMASPSSVLVMRTQDYRDLGGFDEEFQGHGYEDFDFMLRLAMRHGLVPRTEDLLENKSFRAPLLAVGFRKYLGRLSLPRLLEKRVVLHLYHDKPVDSYYHARAKNAVRLQRKLRAYIGTAAGETYCREFLVDEFLECCRKQGVSAQDYLVLFDTRPGHIDRLSKWTDRLKYVLGMC